MNIPEKKNKLKDSSISVIKLQIPKNNQDKTSSYASTIVNNVKNISHEVHSKINSPIEFIRQTKKFVLLNSFDKNWTKHFLEQKEKALIEIELDDKILEENSEDKSEYMDNRKNNNKKKAYSLHRKKLEDIINSKNNIENDNKYRSKKNQNENIKYKCTLYSEHKKEKNIDKKFKKEKKAKGNKIEKPKNHVLHKSSTTRIKIYGDNIKKWGSLFIFSEKRKKLMGIDEDIEESSISRDNMEKKNNIKLLGKNYRKIFNETEKEIINNSKIDTLRNILEELM